MKKLMVTLLGTIALAIVAGISSPAYAANENALRDDNRSPGMMGVSASSGERRRLRTSESGVLMVESSGTATIDGEGWTTTVVTSVQVSTSVATQVFSADATAVTRGVCNEGNAVMRIGPAGVTKSVGFPVQATSCLFLDTNQRYFRGDLFAISNATETVTTQMLEGQP